MVTFTECFEWRSKRFHFHHCGQHSETQSKRKRYQFLYKSCCNRFEQSTQGCVFQRRSLSSLIPPPTLRNPSSFFWKLDTVFSFIIRPKKFSWNVKTKMYFYLLALLLSVHLWRLLLSLFFFSPTHPTAKCATSHFSFSFFFLPLVFISKS